MTLGVPGVASRPKHAVSEFYYRVMGLTGSWLVDNSRLVHVATTAIFFFDSRFQSGDLTEMTWIDRTVWLGNFWNIASVGLSTGNALKSICLTVVTRTEGVPGFERWIFLPNSVEVIINLIWIRAATIGPRFVINATFLVVDQEVGEGSGSSFHCCCYCVKEAEGRTA
jgi:hypothetical protein